MGSQPAPLFVALLLLLLSLAGSGDTTEVRGLGRIREEETASTKVPVRPDSGSPLCSACEDFTAKAVSYLSDRRTQDKVVDILHDACSQTFSLEHKCVELMDSYATLLFTEVSEIEPEEFCKQYGPCRDIAPLLSGARSDGTCEFCRHLLDEVMSKLKDPDAEFEVIQILLKECNKIEGHVQQCKRLVLQYVPLILVNGEKFLEKNDVCALVQACDASPKRAVGSFMEAGLLSDA